MSAVRRSVRIVVRTIDSAEGFASLASLWNRVHEAAATASIFNTWTWQHEWWKVYGGAQPLRILVATEGVRTLGIAALYIQRTTVAGVAVRNLRFVGTGGDTHPDDMGPIIAARARAADTARALCEAVLQLSGWDVLLLGDMSPQPDFQEAMRHSTRQKGLAVRTGIAQRISFMHLPATWSEFLASRSADRRYRIRHARAKLNAAGPARFFVWDDPATLDQAIDRLIHLHRKRWDAAGEAGSFASEPYNDFHRAVIKACAGRGELRLYCLEIAGSVVAMQYAYRFRDGIYLMQCGFDPDFAPLRAGGVLLGYAVEHAIGEGNRIWDFLRGEHQYKREWAAEERATVFVNALRPSMAGWLHQARTSGVPALKILLRQELRRASTLIRRLAGQRNGSAARG
jgi:CelD/BcsL family acetyltransferase involved in cellulose biosynthesis